MNEWNNLDRNLREAIFYPNSYLMAHKVEVEGLLGESLEKYLDENKKRLEALKAFQRKEIIDIDDDGLLEESTGKIIGNVKSLVAFCAPFYLCAPNQDVEFWNKTPVPKELKWLKNIITTECTTDYVWRFGIYGFRPFLSKEEFEGEGENPLLGHTFQPAYEYGDINLAIDDFLDKYQKYVKD